MDGNSGNEIEDIPMSDFDERFFGVLHGLRIGTRIEYYEGDLATQRGGDKTALSKLANVLMQASMEGLVHLSQKRRSPGVYAYLAQRANGFTADRFAQIGRWHGTEIGGMAA